MTDVTLREMTDDEFTEWFARSAHGYADDAVIAFDRPRAQAEAEVAADAAAMLPDGRATEGNHFFRVLASGGDEVGWLWLRLNALGDLWIYDIEIDASLRHRGYGRATMLAAEAFGRSIGAPALYLNVFAHNPNAYALYDSLGYQATSTRMRKPL